MGVCARVLAQRDRRGEHAQPRERVGLGPGRDEHARAVADFHPRHLPASQRGVGHVLQRGHVARVQAQVGHGGHLPRHGLAFGVEGGLQRLQPAVREPAGERQRHRRAGHHAEAEQVVLQVAAHDEGVRRRQGGGHRFRRGVVHHHGLRRAFGGPRGGAHRGAAIRSVSSRSSGRRRPSPRATVALMRTLAGVAASTSGPLLLFPFAFAAATFWPSSLA